MVTNAGSHPILFFDGECNLCNGMVQFIIRRDKKKLFRFAPLQSEAGAEARTHVTLEDAQIPDSFVLFYKGQYYIRSGGAVMSLRLLGGLWQVLYAGMAIPRFLRDGVYNFVSRHRYQWFGRRTECMVPTPDIMDRFLEK